MQQPLSPFSIAVSLVLCTGCPYFFSDPNLAGATDGDGDGYLISDGDCDDSDLTVHPGAPELCDGILNDCNTQSLPGDEIDDDGDGYVECAIDARGWRDSISRAVTIVTTPTIKRVGAPFPCLLSKMAPNV